MDLFNNFFREKRIFITGDTGFKGSWLSLWLNELGATVCGYALPPKNQQDNFVRTKLSSKIQHIDGDIRNSNHFKKALSEFKPDIALHLAAQALVLPSYESPADTFETNLMGTVNFFEAVRQTKSVRVAVNITSDKCYQNNEWIWGYRENDPMGGNDPYSASKGCSELITNSYSKSFFQNGDCLVASVRAGNVVGGGDWSEYRIMPDIFRSHFAKQELLVRNPYATRPWQFVLEPLFGYLRLTQTLYEKGRTFTGGWNFGPVPGKEYSVQDVIEGIQQIIPELKYKIDDQTDKPHEAKLLRLDISKALTLLDWRPLLKFQETVDFTAEGYLAEKESANLYQHRINQIKKFSSKF